MGRSTGEKKTKKPGWGMVGIGLVLLAPGVATLVVDWGQGGADLGGGLDAALGAYCVVFGVRERFF